MTESPFKTMHHLVNLSGNENSTFNFFHKINLSETASHCLAQQHMIQQNTAVKILSHTKSLMRHLV